MSHHLVNLRFLLCVLCLMLGSCLTAGAEKRDLPASVKLWLSSPGIRHATVAFEVVRLPQKQSRTDSTPSQPAIAQAQVIYSYDADRLMTPASVLKLITAATALRTLGADYVWPDSVPLVDTTQVQLAGLEHYNPDWLIEDVITEYVEPLTNALPDSGRVLTDVLHETLVRSLNLQAETALHLLTPSCRLDSALLCVSRYWQERGLDTDESLVMYDGCGLSPSDCITPHFVNAVLADMQFDSAFRSLLPVVGQEGTVRRFLRNTRLAGRARFKSGSLKSVVSYAGYATGSDGRTYAVSIFVNHDTSSHAETRRGLEQVLLALIP